jgi:hypothetical protein
MPTQIPTLDQSLVYTWCPTCRMQGNPRSPLTREMHAIKCSLGHQFTGQQLQAMGADMVKAGEVYTEQPTITDIKWSIFVNPKVREKLESKFSGRLMITLGTYLAALADDSMIILTGEEAAKLRKLGVHNGKEMLASIEGGKIAERERDEAVKSVEKFMGVLKAAGVE